MVTNALAFVNYRNYRTTPENKAKYGQAMWYVSKKPRVLNLVGSGGTLWVVTSRPVPNKERVYSLGYKLADSARFEVWEHLRKKFGEYGVMGDFAKSVHFPSNNITDVLLDLEFMPKKPIKGSKVLGLSLLNARCLSPDDVRKVEEYADKVIHGKSIFISYSNEDTAYADRLQNALEEKKHSVFRDVRSIIGGEQWEPAILRALQNSNAFLLLISQNSAKSPWVKNEVKTALNILGKPGKLQLLLPIVLSADAWDAFPEVHLFQKREWGRPNTREFLTRIANELRLKIVNPQKANYIG